MAVDETGEAVMSDKICRRNNGKQERRRRGGPSVQLPDWVMNKIKRQHVILFLFLFITLTHRCNAVRGHRTGSNNSRVEDYLRSKTNKNRR